jgi:hypothetical protein
VRLGAEVTLQCGCLLLLMLPLGALELVLLVAVILLLVRGLVLPRLRLRVPAVVCV